MTEVESLILSVETRGYGEAERSLASLTQAATAAENAVNSLNRANQTATGAAAQAATATASATAATAANTAAETANTAATTANTAATAAETAATATETAATAAETVATVANTAAEGANTAATTANAGATAASTIAQRASIASRIANTVATAAGTVATGAAAVATRAYTAATGLLGGVLTTVRTAATGLYAQLALFLGPVLAVAAIVSATEAWQGYEAKLKIATGSAEKAGVAFEAIQDFASTTPYSVDQATTAFLKLVNLGLTPSERALTSYGNTAASMGKSLNQMVEAVADAATGEFERLKEFGIKAASEGDKVTFTFQGVKETVGKNAAEIEAYLMKIGETKFAGAMAEQSKTLTGALSNLGDEWDKLLQNISKDSGIGELIASGVRMASEALGELNAMIKSGELAAELEAFGMKWGWIADMAIEGFHDITEFIGDSTKLWNIFGEDFGKQFSYVFDRFPIIAKEAVGLMVDQFLILVEKGKVIASTFVAKFEIEFNRLVSLAKATGSLISDALTFNGLDAGLKAIEDANKAADTASTELANKAAAQYKALDDISTQTSKTAVANTQEALAAYDKQLAKAAELRAQFEADREARKAEGLDRLEQFKAGGDTSGATGGIGGGSGGKAVLDAERKQFEEHLAFLEEGLAVEGQVIASSYEQRKQAILENTALTNQEKQAMTLEALSLSLISEEENLRQSYDRRAAMIQSATGISEQAKTALMTRLTQAREKSLTAIELQNQRDRLQAASTFFGNIASIGSVFGERGFKIAKAAAIAQATIKTYEAATSAYASLAGIPYIGPALGAAAAAAAIVAGAANIAQIKAQQYQAYEMGGMIPAGRYGIVGEAGPELIAGPTVVTSAATTRGKLGNGGGIAQVVIYNQGAPVEATAQQDEERLMIFLKPLLKKNKDETKRELTGDVSRGGGDFSQALEGSYGLRRGSI